ncbi:choline transporter-like protein 2 [Anoplophora glabripennis]|uniref:choline transporter-like protein 2 n=1 Tax=Anoplophora glabripennis TaxID=217634 RepID=UPI0008759D02|nr:choline transporter-like protein 2 [Anoplophora glabripennis]
MLQLMELSEFRNMGPHMPTTIIDIPEKPENRQPTDRTFIIVFAVCVVLLMPFLIYNLAYADIRKLYGYDKCGNLCGTTNTKYEKWDCTGKDYTDKKYLEPTDNEGKTFECVESCGLNYTDLYGVCVRSHSEDDINDDWTDMGLYFSDGMVIFKLIVCSVITVGISVAVLYAFRYVIKVVVWGIVICVFVLGVIIMAVMWSIYSEMTDNIILLILCIISTIFPIVYGVLAYKSRDRISLVILLLTESINAIFAMPSLVFIPICTFFADTIIITLWLTTTIYMCSAGELTADPETDVMTYELSDGTSVTIFYNSVITVWSLYFVSGLQYMVIGGAVSEWYFANDKSYLCQPVRRSFKVAYKFHMGTLFFGSLVITLAHLVRFIIKGLTKNRLTRICVDYCLRMVLDILNFLNQTAYIVTAMHGQPFLKSGKRAAVLLTTNLSDVLLMNIIVQFTLCVIIIFIAFTSLMLSAPFFLGGTETRQDTNAVFVVFLMAVFAGCTFVSLIQTTIDTIFICFCEDKVLNDGMARPYAMSKELMDFVDNVKKVVGKNDYGQMDQQYPQPV